MYITRTIIIITLITSLYGIRFPHLIEKFSFYPYLIFRKRQFCRFISSGFLHKDVWYTVFCMLTLYYFGERLEETYRYYYGLKGEFLFLIVYFGGILIPNILLFNWYKADMYYKSLGASGGISAIVFSYVLFSPTNLMCVFSIICLPVFMISMFYVFYSLYFCFRSGSKVSYSICVGGAIYGMLLNIIIRPNLFIIFINNIKNFLTQAL